MDNRPEYVSNEHLQYLDELRESGVCNMFDAGSYLEEKFSDLTEVEIRKTILYWMHTFGQETR